MPDPSSGVPTPARPGSGRRLARIVALVFVGIGASVPASEGPSLRWRKHDGLDLVEISGLPASTLERLANSKPDDAQWKATLRVGVSEDGMPPSADRPAMLGEYRVEEGSIRFLPRFPLEPGLTYVAVFDPSRLPGLERGQRLIAPITLEVRDLGPLTTLTRIDPTADVLPENVLRFYVHFSRPMSQGEAYEHVGLLDSENRPIDLAFLEIAEELWDRSGTRLTLLIDPGRIKTGLKPRQEAGPVFEVGHSYTLVVDRDWPDADGRPLKDSYRKPFRIGPPDNRQPVPDAWKIHPPAAGSRDPLTMALDGPLDRPLAERLIQVEDAQGDVVLGQAALDEPGTGYRFRPDGPWKSGNYTIRVGKSLEDLAGNSVERPFEVDLFQVDRPADRGQTVVRRFSISP